MQSMVQTYVRDCSVCQQCKYDTSSSPGLLQPIAIPSRFWSVISMDFITGLPKSQGYTVIYVVVDKLSKFAHFMALKHPYTATSVANALLSNVTSIYGIPEKIISDRDPIFLSNFWQALFSAHKTKLAYSTAYHPQTDGQTEVLNRCLETYLRCFTLDAPTSWFQWLPLAQYWYNTSFHSSLGMSPYQALFNQTPPMYIHYQAKDSSNHSVDSALQQRESTVQLLKDNLLKAQNRMKVQADKHRSERVFQVGDWVFLKLQPYRQQSLHARAFHKLAAKYYGPYKIVARVGEVAYKLALPVSSKIHDVFHVSLLKKSHGNHSVSSTLPEVSDTGHSIPLPHRILDKRMVKKNNVAVAEVLVNWSNTEETDNTWEEVQKLQKQFPAFDFFRCLGPSNYDPSLSQGWFH
ncbi:ty3-gypsy retrotransposon protein [Tanacetum coccineum]